MVFKSNLNNSDTLAEIKLNSNKKIAKKIYSYW